MIKELPLTWGGKVALIDDDVYEWAKHHKWYVQCSVTSFYASRKVGESPLVKTVYLHREVMNAPDGVMVDHIDGNGLNCTRDNMRLCTQLENSRNRGLNANSVSGFKGVSRSHRDRKWQAQIRLGGKTIYLGLFDTPEEAALAYDAAALEHHGEFAKTNLKLGRYDVNEGYKKSARRVRQVDPETDEVIKVWNSLSDAARAFAVKVDDISQLCKRNEHYWGEERYKQRLIGGYRFEFAPEIIEKRIEKRYRVDNASGVNGNMVYKRLDLAERECRLKNRYRAGWSVTSWDVEVTVKVG